jgi:hypothetical protein
MRHARTVLIFGVLAMLLATAGLLGWSEPASPVSARHRSALRDVSTSFSPSRDGFAFINHPGVKRESLLGPMFAGLCGGMSYAALDYFYAGSVPPTSGIDQFLLRRDAQSILANGASFALWTIAPDTAPSGALGVATTTRSTELPALDKALKNGPVPLGLVKARDLDDIGGNHQVVAYALHRRGTTVSIDVYDPNHPGTDNTLLRVDLSKPGPITQWSDDDRVDSWRGFFVERYAPAKPPAGF